MTIAETLIIHNKMNDIQEKATALSFRAPRTSDNIKTFLFSDGSKIKFNQTLGKVTVC